MDEQFTCKIEVRLGGRPSDLQEVKLMSSITRWTPDGLLHEAGPRHADQLLRGLLKSECSGVRGISFPGYRRDAAAEDVAEPLDLAAGRGFRALAARASYLSLDRPDLGFAAKECCWRMAAPTTTDWAALVRLIRYLIARPSWTKGPLSARTSIRTSPGAC
eukprot:11454136-Alexandrium_andersonii.AAC.1